MTEPDYYQFVASRTKPMSSPTLNLLHAVVGISGEAGEALDAVKKAWVYNKPLDEVNLKEELGDSLFYIAMACNILGTSISELIDLNVAKLMQRYPTGYSDTAAQARADKS